MVRKTLSRALVGAMVLAASAKAGVISVNFSEDDRWYEQVPADWEAGVWPRTNWNNTTNGASGTKGNLVDSDGNTNTTTSVTWSSSNTWGDGTANAGIYDFGDARITRGYLDDGDAGVSFTVSNVPYTNYTVVLLMSTDSNGGTYTPATINGGTYTSEGEKRQYDNSQWQWNTNTTIIATGLTNSTLSVAVDPNASTPSPAAILAGRPHHKCMLCQPGILGNTGRQSG